MVSRSLAVPLRGSAYIRDSCLSNNRALSNVRACLIRTFNTASSHSSELPLRRTSRPSERACRARTSRINDFAFIKPSVSSQPYSTETSTPHAATSGIASLPRRSLISLSGADAAKFLQGLITNNVDSTRLSPFYSAFLDARGRVLWDVFVWVWPELVAEQGHWGCYIEVDASEADSLMSHLKKHKLRSKIAIKGVPQIGPDGIRVWAAWGGAHQKVNDWAEIAGLEDPRAPGLFRYLANADRDTIAEGVEPLSPCYYQTQRYVLGIPEGQLEIPRETALPMECNLDLNGGIDFKKGCYVGQELTIRTKHTGVVRKRILPVRFHHSESTATQYVFPPTPQTGKEIKALDEAGAMRNGRPGGKIVAAIGTVGLASCRLEAMTSMRVSAEGGTFRPGMQFGVDVHDDVVKVEPVLHDWFVKRKELLWDKEARKKVMSVKEQDSMELE